MTELRFDGRVAVITGGGRGLGAAHARLLAARGCKLVINDPGVSMAGDATSEGPAEALAAEIRSSGGEAVANTDSVATSEGGAAIVQSALDAFGQIDILIHSAGNVRKAALAEMSAEDWQAVIDVHLNGAFHVTRPAFAAMLAQGYGRIVYTSSVNGIYSNRNVANYSAAKGGMIALANTAAIEGFAANVKANCILPAAVTRMSEGIDTSQFPPMTPEMVAPMVAYLCHESCEITGEMLIAAAGRMARAWVAESKGLYRPEWSIEDVAANLAAIRDMSAPLHFTPAPQGHLDHLFYSFGMTKGG
jgi:NAD(P)-dependent dehydrogenase (short-subunit alcohol dehydrogenase family)